MCTFKATNFLPVKKKLEYCYPKIKSDIKFINDHLFPFTQTTDNATKYKYAVELLRIPRSEKIIIIIISIERR